MLWVTTNEPQLHFEGLRPPGPGARPIRPALYPMAEIRRRLLEVYLDPRGAAMPGKSVNLGNVALEGSRTTTPSFTLAMNSLLPGEAQRGHRHNAVAVTLVLAGEGCYSLIDGERVDWEPDTVMITPPTAFHSHHNDGGEPGAVPHRPGRGRLLPLPDDGIQLRVASITGRARRRSGNQRVRFDGSTRMVSSRPGPVDTSEISHSIRSSSQRR